MADIPTDYKSNIKRTGFSAKSEAMGFEIRADLSELDFMQEKYEMAMVATESVSDMKEDLERIGEHAARIAKQYLIQSDIGLSPKTIRSPQNRMIHDLRQGEGIGYEVMNNGIILYNEAKDVRDHVIGKIVEEGFRHYGDGTFVGPWPHLKPGIQQAAIESRKPLTESMINKIAAGQRKVTFGDTYVGSKQSQLFTGGRIAKGFSDYAKM